jgi:hypothetical protein
MLTNRKVQLSPCNTHLPYINYYGNQFPRQGRQIEDRGVEESRQRHKILTKKTLQRVILFESGYIRYSSTILIFERRGHIITVFIYQLLLRQRVYRLTSEMW